MYRRPQYETLRSRLLEPRRFIQVLAGPRQVGKTTLALQVLEELEAGGAGGAEGEGLSHHYASADLPTLQPRAWLQQQWELGRLAAKEEGAVLVLDEVQKLPGWSETVKALWDADSRRGTPLKVLLLGSAPLLVQRGLTESLAGRFEVIHLPHWSYPEMKRAFGFDLDRYLYFGGYPGAAGLVGDRERWVRYIQDALIETSISRDVMLLTRVEKPALLRRLFHLGCAYSGQILSYQKMLGQLQEAGNTTTLAHYLQLLEGAGLLVGLPKFSGRRVRQRGSSPKLQVLNTALMSALDPRGLKATREDRDYWGRLVESAVGAHLANQTLHSSLELFYWRERSLEVDFVVRQGASVLALEVKSGRRGSATSGMGAFQRRFRPPRQLLVGGEGLAVEEFLNKPVTAWFE